jgi:hypothetical protein
MMMRAPSWAVMSWTSYGGAISTRSMPQSPSRAAMRTALRASRGSSPPGSGVPVPGGEPGVDGVDVERQEDRVGVLPDDLQGDLHGLLDPEGLEVEIEMTVVSRSSAEVDLDTLTGELLAVVEETMQPTRTSLWLQFRPRLDPSR